MILSFHIEKSISNNVTRGQASIYVVDTAHVEYVSSTVRISWNALTVVRMANDTNGSLCSKKIGDCDSIIRHFISHRAGIPL